MKLSINHQTTYFYDSMTKRSVQYIRMTPKNMPHQHINSWQVMLPKVGLYQPDGFGNLWTVLTRNEPHNNLQIQANGIVVINEDTQYLLPDRVPLLLFCTKTALTKCSEAIRDFYAPILSKKTVTSIGVAELRTLAEQILNVMPYTPGVTQVHTTAIDAFMDGQGVCQDHTHVFLACCRDFGIPARYVSGYLYTQSDNHIQSHAWAEAFVDNKWYTFDVSNQLFNPCQHVYVAFGRDYNDAAPVRGMREGGGIETMTSQVLVDLLAA